MREGRVPPVLQAHAEVIAWCILRIESTVAHDGEQTRADRTRYAEAGGSPSQTPWKGAALPGSYLFIQAAVLLDLVERLLVLDLPGRRPFLQVLDTTANLGIDLVVDLHVLLEDVAHALA